MVRGNSSRNSCTDGILGRQAKLECLTKIANGLRRLWEVWMEKLRSEANAYTPDNVPTASGWKGASNLTNAA